MTIQEKLSKLREEYKTAQPERRKAILMQAKLLKSAENRVFPQKDNYDIMRELVEKNEPAS